MLPCNIPTKIVKPLTVIKKLDSYPLDDEDKSYYTALAKQSHPYNQVLFLSAKVISYIVQTEHKAEHKPPPIEHTSPIRNTPEKHSPVLNNRTLRAITHLLDPYKRNSSDSLITTLTHIVHCFDRTQNFIESLDLDPQRITQSSQAIQSALESITTLFNTTNLH